MNYYCYVYYDEDWQGYYVGKGQDRRAEWRRKTIQVPDSEHIQKFYFEHEWQAWECEIELIALWKRQCDGGSLLNQSTGGPGGSTGVKRTQKHKEAISKAHKGKIVSAETRKKLSASNKGKGKGIKHSPEICKKRSESMKKWHARRRQEREACPPQPPAAVQDSDPTNADVS